MKITIVFDPQDAIAGEILKSAMIRSFTDAQIAQADYESITDSLPGAVFINPQARHRGLLKKQLSSTSKTFIAGYLGNSIAEEIGLGICPLPREAAEWTRIDPDPGAPFNVTPVSVAYETDNHLAGDLGISPRYLCRYDFTDEWNNAGYGRITNDGTIWSLCHLARAHGAARLAWLQRQSGEDIGDYACFSDTGSSAVLWYNRQVGPVDSVEWQVVERFFGDYRPRDLPCFPYLAEIPFGYQGVVTMRLDCDQATSSARPLFDLYSDYRIPFSLAVLTNLDISKGDAQFLADVVESGGGLFTHSHNHFPGWGGNYVTALSEARRSKEWLETALPQVKPIRYTVSPFHQNPRFAVAALRDAGYSGFVSGIIHDDPEFLLGRAGRVPWIADMISLSQQCMLHGDCYHRYGNSVEPYKESFAAHLQNSSIFGYLDHPFSREYQYGWRSEEERLRAHEELLRFIGVHEAVWRPNLSECLDFLVKRNGVSLTWERGAVVPRIRESGTTTRLPHVAYRFQGSTYAV